MSHIPTIVAEIAQAARTAAETFSSYPDAPRMSLCSAPRPDAIRLSMRPSRKLRARAVELNRMATTASTAAARTALNTLAARFVTLAAQRELSEALGLTDDEAVDR